MNSEHRRRSATAAALSLAGALVASVLTAPSTAHAQTAEIGRGRNFGIGVVAGFPGFGLSMNYFFNYNISLQIDPQVYHWGDTFWAGGRVDLLFFPTGPLLDRRAFDLRWYVGPGVGVAVGLNNADVLVVPEAAIGIGLHLKKFPIDVMAEAVPQFWIVTGNGNFGGFWVSGALNARYYF